MFKLNTAYQIYKTKIVAFKKKATTCWPVPANLGTSASYSGLGMQAGEQPTKFFDAATVTPAPRPSSGLSHPIHTAPEKARQLVILHHHHSQHSAGVWAKTRLAAIDSSSQFADAAVR